MLPSRASHGLLAFLMGTAVAAFAQPIPYPAGPPGNDRIFHGNIVIIVADDMGVDLIGAYGEATNPPCTPHLDQLAAQGVLFRNAWANPVCSPTRAQILTGLHGFRNGIGRTVYPTGTQSRGITTQLPTLPKVLVDYESSAVGKWHLSDLSQGLLHPEEFGFDYYAGSRYNLQEELDGDYYEWVKTGGGQQWIQTTYATTDTANDAIARAAAMTPPWLLYVAFNAPHLPAHVPPLALCDATGTCPSQTCPVDPNDGTRELVKAAVEALDAKIGRMLAGIRQIDPDVVVIFVGDSGSQRDVPEPPFSGDHAKRTLYEGGVNVPLIIAGPNVLPRESTALVAAVDIFATVVDLAGLEVPTPDSVSMTPYMFNPGDYSRRKTVYAENFRPNFDPTQQGFNPTQHTRAVRNRRFKLIRHTDSQGTIDALYDLLTDPFEQENLYPPQPGRQERAYQFLADPLHDLGVD